VTLDVAALNAAPAAEFVASVAPLFEGAPGFLARLADARPFGSWAALFDAARMIVHEMPEPLQVELIDAHPRLGAPPGSVSAMSFEEQGYDRERAAFTVDAQPQPDSSRTAAFGTGLLPPFEDDTALAPPGDRGLGSDAAVERERARIAAKLEYLNGRYEARFGFRYCVFVAGRPRAELVPEMAAALARDRKPELHRALDAVIDIAADRCAALGAEQPPSR
jgi:2-oxo-4-hydroxy-4-carboxy--5-ureidoimidazoline (OHCU) decarboxylase